MRKAKQTHLKDIYIAHYLKNLTENEVRILNLLDQGYYQRQAARLAHVSPSLVNRLVKELSERGLLSLEMKDPLQTRGKSVVLHPSVKEFLKTDPEAIKESFCEPHNIRLRFPILYQSRDLSVLRQNRHARSRCFFSRSWAPRGGRSRYHFICMNEKLTVGITVYPGKSIVVSQDRDSRQRFRARSIEDATNILTAELTKAAEQFQKEQRENHCIIKLGEPRVISRTHYAFPSMKAKELTGMSFLGGALTIDNSPEKFGDRNTGELETTSIDIANIVDQGLQTAFALRNMPFRLAEIETQLSSISEALPQILSTIRTVEAHVMGSTTAQQKVDTLVIMLGQTLATQKALQDLIQAQNARIAELENQLRTRKTPREKGVR